MHVVVVEGFWAAFLMEAKYCIRQGHEVNAIMILLVELMRRDANANSPLLNRYSANVSLYRLL